MPQINSISEFLLLVLLFFGIITGRYFLVAGLFYLVFYIWSPGRWQKRKFHTQTHKKDQLFKEIKWSLATATLFALIGSGTYLMWQNGWTQIYLQPLKYGWWYLPLSFFLTLFLHEYYYYWLHRWMHRPSVFRIIHKVHHDSHITSPFTAFSFHPLEGFLQAIALPIILLILPMHVYVLLLQLLLMTLSSVINHLGIELYPARFNQHRLGKWVIGATHHSLHHKQFKFNFGLYFTFLDKMHRTESPDYDEKFEKLTVNKKFNE